ncbi:MAG TPA: DUF4412 domain-containing protein [Polyangiaceae bacterium]|nr:DUF4412 domain-containing protein [Polyangiaceae bacterium]
MKTAFVAPIALLLSVNACSKKSDATNAAGSAAAPAGDTPALAALGALKGFEGEITVSVKSTKERKPVPPITIAVKGAKLRFDTPEGMENGARMAAGAHIIVDGPGKRMLAVVDEKKQVVVIGFDTFADQMKAFKVPGAPGAPGEPSVDSPSRVTKTGKTDTVAGYKCEEWEAVNAKGEKAHICVAGEEASFFELPTLSLPAEHAWAKELFDGHHFPVRMIGYDTSGAEESRIEVTKLEKKPEPDALFEPPPGYQTMDMGAAMKGMMGALSQMGGMPGMAPPGASGAVPGAFQLPPGVKLPPGMQVPNLQNMQLPAGAAEMMKQMQERAKAAGIQPPPAPQPH